MGNRTDPLPAERLLGVLRMIQVYQRTGVTPFEQDDEQTLAFVADTVDTECVD